MREVLRSNDAVMLSFAQAVLHEAGIYSLLADQHISVMEGAIGAFPRRLLVAHEDWGAAYQALSSAGLSASLMDDGDLKVCKETAAGPADVTDDAFLGGGLRVLQPNAGYRAGIDALLLAAAAPLRVGRQERVLDVGAGVGVVGLAVARRVPLCEVTLVEREPFLAELAQRNIARNGLEARVRVIAADVSRRLDELDELAPDAEGFDHVLANPPYHAEGDGTVSVAALRAAANVMPGGGLARWVRFMAAMARPGGSATLIHRADAIGELLTALAGRFGGLLVFPLYPREGKSATRVLVQGTKGSNAPIELRPGLVLHDRENRFQPQVEAVLRHGASLALAQPTNRSERKRATRS